MLTKVQDTTQIHGEPCEVIFARFAANILRVAEMVEQEGFDPNGYVRICLPQARDLLELLTKTRPDVADEIHRHSQWQQPILVLAHFGIPIPPQLFTQNGIVAIKEYISLSIDKNGLRSVFYVAATKPPAEVAAAELAADFNAMAVQDDPFKAIVREAIREYRSVPQPSAGMGATEFVRAALKKQGFLSVSGDDIDEAIIEVEQAVTGA